MVLHLHLICTRHKEREGDALITKTIWWAYRRRQLLKIELIWKLRSVVKSPGCIWRTMLHEHIHDYLKNSCRAKGWVVSPSSLNTGYDFQPINQTFGIPHVSLRTLCLKYKLSIKKLINIEIIMKLVTIYEIFYNVFQMRYWSFISECYNIIPSGAP
jgi:hypothetical protein